MFVVVVFAFFLLFFWGGVFFSCVRACVCVCVCVCGTYCDISFHGQIHIILPTCHNILRNWGNSV